MAFVIQSGETITISETLRDDLYAAGETVLVTAAGTVDGDVAAAARSIAIGGKGIGGGGGVRAGGSVVGAVRLDPPAGGGIRLHSGHGCISGVVSCPEEPFFHPVLTCG